MKKILILVLLIFFIHMALADPSVSIDIPKEVEKGNSFKVILVIDTDSEDKFDIAVFIPKDWEIADWDISPTLDIDFETSIQEFLGEEHKMNHWKFNSVSDEIIIKYIVNAKNVGEYEFITLWIYPRGFDFISDKVRVVSQRVEEQSSASTSSITGFIVKEEINSENISEMQIEVLNVKAVKNTISEIKDIIFNIPY